MKYSPESKIGVAGEGLIFTIVKRNFPVVFPLLSSHNINRQSMISPVVYRKERSVR